MKQKLGIKNIISITVLNLKQVQSLDLSQYLLIDYRLSKIKSLPVVYIITYQKKTIEMYFLAISSFID